jgi:hypothetical protein
MTGMQLRTLTSLTIVDIVLKPWGEHFRASLGSVRLLYHFRAGLGFIFVRLASGIPQALSSGLGPMYRSALFGPKLGWSDTCLGCKVVALPSRPLQALSDGKGFKMIGAAVLWKFAIRSWQAPFRDISQICFLSLPSTKFRALFNGIGFRTIGAAVL